MTQLIIARSEVFEGEDLNTAARVANPLGVAFQIANVTSWDLHVFDRSENLATEQREPLDQVLGVVPATTNTNVGYPSTPLIWSDTLRTDGFWSGGPPGYNFLHLYTAPFAVEGNHTYLKEFHFTTDYNLVVLQHEFQVAPVHAA